jgi:soluble lytic murein transglycosylase-like protein
MRMIDNLIRVYATKRHVEPQVPDDLLIAIAQTESDFNSLAISPVGAMGMFQFMPITLLDLAKRFDVYFSPFDIEGSVIAAKVYLSWLRKCFKDYKDWTVVLAAWNWGYGNVQKWLRKEKEMPVETKNFIEKVMNLYETSK